MQEISKTQKQKILGQIKILQNQIRELRNLMPKYCCPYCDFKTLQKGYLYTHITRDCTDRPKPKQV